MEYNISDQQVDIIHNLLQKEVEICQREEMDSDTVDYIAELKAIDTMLMDKYTKNVYRTGRS